MASKRTLIKEESPALMTEENILKAEPEETFKVFGLLETKGRWHLVTANIGKLTFDISGVDVLDCRTKPKALIELRKKMFFNGIDP